MQLTMRDNPDPDTDLRDSKTGKTGLSCSCYATCDWYRSLGSHIGQDVERI